AVTGDDPGHVYLAANRGSGDGSGRISVVGDDDPAFTVPGFAWRRATTTLFPSQPSREFTRPTGLRATHLRLFANASPSSFTRSGRFEMMPSTPISMKRRNWSGRSTVQTLTRRPLL